MIDRLGARLPPIVARPAPPPIPPVANARPRAPAAESPASTTDRGKAPVQPIDSAKVDRIRAAIAQGTYAIQPSAIAERMIATDLAKRPS